ncbi:restriction endonuclease subunit S [Macrococcoides canis]|uniref:restriction endonuclease subunit S n=1 Tax=Macrococcoides canis TaxID=1855823 RepID=UPI00105D118C|nr:restriction endonuclease subunit S [Macrococcus canis]TDM30207.1 restriction endonuclease subunit S [Macrococcus canis]
MFLKNVNKHYNLGKDTYTWEQRELGEVVDFSIKTNSLSRANLSQDSGEIKNIHYGDILVKFNSVLDLKTEKLPFINSEYSTLDKFQFLKDGDLVFADAAEDNSVGKCIEVRGVLDDKVTSGLHTIAGTPKMNFASFYLGYYLNSNNYHDKILPLIQGTKVSSISKNNLTKSIINYPKNFEEQQKIGKLFIEIDQTITLLQRKIDNLNKVKKGLLQKLFPSEQSINPMVRFSGFNQDWEQRELGEVVKNFYNGQTPSRNNRDYWNGSVNWMTSGELNKNIVLHTNEKITEIGKKKTNLKIINKGTLVIAITGLEAAGTRGNCAITGIDTTLNQSCMAIIPSDNLTTKFLFQWYLKYGEEYGQKFTQGTKQQSYNAEILKKLKIKIPNLKEQHHISELLSQLDQAITLLQKELEMNKQVKKGFLQKLFPKE